MSIRKQTETVAPGLRRREPLTDTQLLLWITIGIFFGMYFLAMAIWGGGFLRVQQLFDMLNNNASLIIISCGLTIVMIAGGIDISVGGITALVVMSCVVHLDSPGGSVLTSLLLALGIGLVHMAGMGLEEVDLADADEGTCLLGLVPEGVDQLIDLQGQVPVGADPDGEHGVHCRL